MSNPTVVTLVEGGGGGGTDVNTTTTSRSPLGATPPMVSFVPFQVCQPEKCTTPKTVASMDDDDTEEDEEMPWDDPDWIPLTKSGRQKTPNVIRGELQRFIDSSAQSQTSILRDAGITPSSFAKFMNRKYYKHAESAYQNESYWRGARYLAKMAHQQKQTTTKSKKDEATPIAAVTSGAEKRKASTNKDSSDGTLVVASKKLKKTAGPPKETAAEAEAWMRRVLDFEGQEGTDKAQMASLDRIFDACTVVVKNIKQCLVDHPGLTKVAFCQVALGGCSPATLNKFLLAKGQNGQASMVYPSAYAFFERLRIMKGEAKSKARRKNEQEKPDGFDTSILRQTTLVMLGHGNW